MPLLSRKEPNRRVWINEDQYFDKVPLIAWEFYIGGYQSAQRAELLRNSALPEDHCSTN
ncbi:MAG: type ISP restriction/modification enzyme [Balneolales bacterium]